MSRPVVRSLLPVLILLAAPLSAADVQGEWRRLGPEGGSVLDLASAPSNPLVLYASAEGAVYKSTDGGATWAYTGFGSSYWAQVNGLAVDAVDPSTVYGNRINNLARSLDGGRTWDFVAPAALVNDVTAHPRRGGLVFAATDSGLFRSSNSGATWQALRGKGLPQSYKATDVFVDPYFPNRVFVATITRRSERLHLFKSLDAGLSWQVADGGSLQGDRIVTVATDPRSSKNLYAAGVSSVYRSTDGGSTWERKTLPAGSGALFVLKLLPAQPNSLYAGTQQGLFRSRNGAATWTKLGLGLPEAGAIRALLVSSGNAGQSLLAGVSTFIRRGGVFRSSDAGSSWTLASRGLTATTVVSIAFGQPGTLWVVANGVLFRSTDQGLTWSRIRPGPPTSSYPTSVVVDPVDPSNVFTVLNDGGIRRSADGGATWEIAGDPKAYSFLVPVTLAIDPATPSTLYAAGDFVSKSTDRGTTWTRLETDPEGVFSDFVVAPSSPSTLYAFRGVRILRSTDAGATWFFATYPRRLLANAFAVDPLVSTTLYLATVEGVYRSTDGGSNWSQFSSAFTGQKIQPLEADPSGVLYAGIWLNGLYSIAPGDSAWSRLAGSGPWEYKALVFDPHDPCRIYVGAVGQSLLVFTKSGTSGCPGEP
jgi:photosystem II stability/assembly factor-like uncharacterized protein